MKTNLTVIWYPEKMLFYESDKSGYQKMAVFSLADSAELIASQVKKFLGARKMDDVLLAIPRSEVLQRKMALSRSGAESQNLESYLGELLPYAPKDMAYSIAMDGSDGLLYAIPEQKIKGIMAFLLKLGIRTDEVISEDQALFWLYQDKAVSGQIVVIDATSDRFLFLALSKNAIHLSNTYPAQEDLKTILREMSYALLEAGIRPTLVIVSGDCDRDEIAKVLGVPIEIYVSETLETAQIPAVVAGTKLRAAKPVISLLPSHQKIQNREKKEAFHFKAALGWVAIFLTCLIAFNTCHWMFLSHKKNLLKQESVKIAPAVLEVKHMKTALDAIHDAKFSKERLLRFIKSLAERVPPSVRVKEIQIDGPSIVFQGESPSHAVLTQSVQAMEKMEAITDVKLEHARLRKKLNQDFFEFEITARWRS